MKTTIIVTIQTITARRSFFTVVTPVAIHARSRHSDNRRSNRRGSRLRTRERLCVPTSVDRHLALDEPESISIAHSRGLSIHPS